MRRELRDVTEPPCEGKEEEGTEDVGEEREKGGGVASGRTSLVLVGALPVMVGDADLGRRGGCGQRGERVDIGNVGDSNGVANGLSFGRGGSWETDDVFPLPLGVIGESESRSGSATSSLTTCICAVASGWSWPPSSVIQ